MTIQRDGHDVQAKFTVMGFTFTFHWDTGSDWAAVLLTDKLQSVTHAHLQRLRSKYYALGYAEGRAKKAKRLWFSGHWSEPGPP